MTTMTFNDINALTADHEDFVEDGERFVEAEDICYMTKALDDQLAERGFHIDPARQIVTFDLAALEYAHELLTLLSDGVVDGKNPELQKLIERFDVNSDSALDECVCIPLTVIDFLLEHEKAKANA